MTIGSATTDQRYVAKSRCTIANRAIEALTLVNNPSAGVIATADAAGSAAIAALTAAGIAGGGDPTKAPVGNGDVIPLKTADGTAIASGVAVVASGALTNVSLDPSDAVVANAGSITLTSFINAPGAATATVVGGVMTQAKLPANQALLKHGTKIVMNQLPAITGTYVNGYTFTISNGQITAIVAS